MIYTSSRYFCADFLIYTSRTNISTDVGRFRIQDMSDINILFKYGKMYYEFLQTPN